MQEPRQTRALQQIAEQAISDDLDLWPAIRTRIAASTARRPSARRWRRRSAVGFATAAALTAIAGVSLAPWNRTEPVSAQVILNRATAAATGNESLAVTSYHLLMTRQIPAKGNATITTEIWYDGDNRQRNDQQIRDSQGNVVSTQKVIVNDDQTWIISTENGATRVVHTIGTASMKPADVPAKQSSLAALLTRYSTDKSCMAATETGTGEIASRPVYVITLHPRASGCSPDSAGPAASGPKGGLSSSDDKAGRASEVGQITLWVDEMSFLPLATELRNLDGTVIDRSKATRVEYNVTIPDSIFSYTPSAGATILNLTGEKAADVKRALSVNPKDNLPPTRTPSDVRTAGSG